VALKVAWAVLLVLGFVLSMAGAIWYGALEQDFTKPIDTGRLFINLPWARALIYLVFVIVIMVGTAYFSRALRTLMRQRPDLQATRQAPLSDKPKRVNEDQASPALGGSGP
jgi:hypothetical protein